MQPKRIFVFLIAALLVLPAGAATITNGIDAWVTPGDGSSFASFADDPIPAGFFCAGSEPFTGVIQ